MADSATGLNNPNNFEEIRAINGAVVSSNYDAIKLLTRLKELNGDLEKNGNLKNSIQANLLDQNIDLSSVDEIMMALAAEKEVLEQEEEVEAKKISEEKTEIEEELVSNVDIRTLVKEYEEHIKKGLTDQEARDRIYKDFAGNNKENIDRFIKKQQEIYNQTLEKIKEEIPKTTTKTVINEEKIAKIVSEEILVKEQVLSEKIGSDKAKVVTEQIIEEVVVPHVIKNEEIKETELNKYASLGEEEKNELKESFDLIDTKVQIENKVEILSNQIRENLQQDKRFEDKIEIKKEKIEEVLREEIKNNLDEDIILSDNEKSDRLAEKIVEAVQRSEEIELEPELKTTIRTESIKIEKDTISWIKANEIQLAVVKGQIIEEKIQKQIYTENKNLTPEQIKNVREYTKLIKSIYTTPSEIDQYREELIFKTESTEVSRDKANESWTDVKALTKVLKMKPAQLEEFSAKYRQIKNGMGNIKLPFNIKESRSLDKIVRLADNPTIKSLINRSQRYISTFERINNFTSGRIFYERVVTRVGKVFVEKIGNQAVKAFAENSLQIIAKNGMEKGMGMILKGILSGGVKAGTSAAASGAAAGSAAAAGGAAGAAGASAAVPVVGWIVAAVIAAYEFVIKPVFKFLGNLAKKLNIDLGTKEFLQDTFGKFFGGIADFGLKVGAVLMAPTAVVGGISAISVITPIIIVVVIGLFTYQTVFANQVSSVVPPISQDITDIGGGGGGMRQEYDPGSVRALSFTFSVLPVPTEFTRNDLINTAKSVLGLPYFWGGKYPHVGTNPNWGILTTVTADGSWSTGKQIPLGLDCSGFVDWVYYQLIQKQVSGGGGSASICQNANTVSRSNLKPGDVGCMDGHVGLYIGSDTDGEPLFIQAVGQAYRDNEKGLVAGQVLILKEGVEYNGYKGPRFTHYGRPKVTFKE